MTGELGNKIDSLWEIFWNGGITNPLDVVEQMTYSVSNDTHKKYKKNRKKRFEFSV